MPADGLFLTLSLIVLLLLAALLSLFLFFGPGKERLANRLLGLLIALIGLEYINLLINGLLLGNRFYAYNSALEFLEAPLLLLYARTLLGVPFKPERDWFHLIPFAIVGLIGLAPGQMAALKLSFWGLAPLLYLAIYVGAALAFSRARIPLLKEIRSNIPAGQARALFFVLIAWGGQAVLGASSVLLVFGGMAEKYYRFQAGYILLDVLLLLGFTLLIYRREEPVAPVSMEEEALAAVIAQRGPADAATIKKNAALFKKLDVILQQDKLYLDPGLTLPQFSRLAGNTPQEVSLAINSVGGQSFFDYINGYRVFTAQELLADKDKGLSLREVMYAAGFHSKHTFETAFRKVAGMTPDQFTKKNR